MAAEPAHNSPATEAHPPLTYRALLSFHLPLAGSSVLTLLAQPLVNFCLARLAQPTLSLAAWPVVLFLTMIMRSGAMALPEVIIALDKTAADHKPLRRFSIGLAAASLVAMSVLVLTPLAGFYLFGFQNTTPEVAALAHTGLVLSIPIPFIATLIYWLRGSLIGRRRTRAVNGGMVVRLTIFTVALAAGLLGEWPGIPTAVIALNLSVLCELLYLAWKVKGRPIERGTRS